MDVRCERCQTEYEFDDALVSGRGTTVKCTACGHKFKIRRVGGDYSEDFWHVSTAAGKTLVFTSLRELQRAIQSGLVARHDTISRGGLPAKPIGQIPELAPFFEQRRAEPAPRAPAPEGGEPPSDRTVKVAPKENPAALPPPGANAAALAPPRQRQSTRPDFLAPPAEPAPAPRREFQRTLLGTGDGAHLRSRLSHRRPGSVPPDHEVEPPTERNMQRPGAASPPASEAVDTPPRPQLAAQAARAPDARPPEAEAPRLALSSDQGSLSDVRAAPPAAEEEAPPRREVRAPEVVEEPRLDRTAPILRVPALAAASQPTPAPPSFEPSSPLPPMSRKVAEAMAPEDEAHETPRSIPVSHGEPTSLPGRRRPVGGYIVASVVVVCVGVLAVVWARQNLGAKLGPRPPASVATTTDPRVERFVTAGEKALAEGDLELAKESFDKASALAESDPRVLLGVARLAAARADGAWLEARLLTEDAKDERRAVDLRLKELSERATQAADAAMKATPEDPAAVRAKIDALRIAGNREGARALVARISSSGSQPETAYVLAALDVAESEPLWATVIERLRTAVSAEAGPSRARPLLVYALARSGAVTDARVELENLAQYARPHRLLGPLRTFVARAVETRDAGAADATVEAPPPSATDTKEPVAKGETPRGDAKSLVAQGEAARARGDYDRARLLYSAALDRNPNDSEALAGLAAIAHAQHDLNGARASYRRVLQINPSYLPALVGAGDVEWESGNKAAAVKAYKEIVDRFPEGSYPARVKQRIESGQASSSGAPSPSTTASDDKPAPPASETPTAPAPPTATPEGGP